jgi:hypothetical protein
VSRYREQIAAALRAVTIRGSTRYAWLGRLSRQLPASQRKALNALEQRAYLVACLREELYSSFYCHGRPVTARWGEPEPLSADPRLEDSLSQANTGSGGWQPGWMVQRIEGAEAVVATDRLRARVAIADCKSASDAIRAGDAVSIRLPKELPDHSPGFYTAVCETPSGLVPSASVIRVYWNIDDSGARTLVRELTTLLNARAVPFRLKVADHPARLRRCDAAVLYLPIHNFAELRGPLGDVAITLKGLLGRHIPAFTLELAPGVGLAEDRGDAGSFGVRRCALLADGLVRAHERGVSAAQARLAEVAACFAEADVLIDAPYLEPSLAGRHVL